MSLIRSIFILSAAVMLLPADGKKQEQFSATASHTAERTTGYCERNPTTCQAGRELWATFVRKAEYGLELGAGLVREHVLRAMLEPKPPQAEHPIKASVPATAPANASHTRVVVSR